MEFCQQFQLNTLAVTWLAEHSTWISWAPHCPEVPNAFAELPDRPWLTNPQEARAATRVREPFKENYDLLFQQQHYKMLHANSNYSFPQSKPCYQL